MVGFCHAGNMADVSNFTVCETSVWKACGIVDRASPTVCCELIQKGICHPVSHDGHWDLNWGLIFAWIACRDIHDSSGLIGKWKRLRPFTFLLQRGGGFAQVGSCPPGILVAPLVAGVKTSPPYTSSQGLSLLVFLSFCKMVPSGFTGDTSSILGASNFMT